MIYICTHKEPTYTLNCPYELVDNKKYPLSDEWRHLRGMRMIYEAEDLPDEIGIFQYKRRLQDTSIPEGYRIVVPNNFEPCCMREQYQRWHDPFCMPCCEYIINDPDFTEYINIPRNEEAYWHNMFIMNKLDYKKYCKWLFNVLDKKTEILGDINNCFLAERLGSYWIWKNIPRNEIFISKFETIM